MRTEQALIERLLGEKKTIAAAESCTGGLVGKLLTDIPGSSGAFLGGIVSYTNGVKQRVLGVPAEILEQYTAVSPQTAEKMAIGARNVIGADCAVSVTGLAGPDGDGTGRPVGLVYVAFADKTGTAVQELHLTGGRAEIRAQAAEAVLQLALAHA
jgi:PncC family amidohydrolase